MSRESPTSKSAGAVENARPKINEAMRKRILGAVRDQIKPVPTTWSYRLGLFLAAVVLVILIAVYVFLIGVVILLSIRHAVNNTQLFLGAAGGGKRTVAGFLIYALGVVAGPVVALFLIKPLFSEQAFQGRSRHLKPDAEPLLFEYVGKVCDAVGAPRPHAIRLDANANAAAAFEGGFLGVIGPRRLGLIIGLPLVAGLTLRQFTGVLAHEFGHFAQGGAMRLGFLIRSILMWFARVVYERDVWDYRLENFARGADIRIQLLVGILRLTIWLGRGVLWCLMWIGHAVSCLVSRHQEYDADLHEVRLVGWPVVGSALRRAGELGVAHAMAMDDLQKFYQEEQLPNDLPRLIASNVRQITPQVQQRLAKLRRDAKTGWFDTHPSDRDRVRAAKADGSTGLLDLGGLPEDTPATVLFSNFEPICRSVSTQFYRDVLGKQFHDKLVQSVDKLIELRDAETAAAKALARYFQVRLPTFAPLPLGDSSGQTPASPKETAATLKSARTEMLEHLDKYKHHCQRLERAEQTLFDSNGAAALLEVGCRFRPDQFGLRQATQEAVDDRRENAERAVETISTKMLDFEQAAGNRLSCALQLLRLPKVQERIENGPQLAAEIARLLPLARLTGKQVTELPAFRVAYHRFFLLLAGLSSLPRNEPPSKKLIDGLHNSVGELCHRMKVMKRNLGRHPYPFDHSRADITIDEFLVPVLPDADDEETWGHAFDATTELFERLIGLQTRLFARLAFAAEKVETALGLPPLPEPVLDDVDDDVAGDVDE